MGARTICHPIGDATVRLSRAEHAAEAKRQREAAQPPKGKVSTSHAAARLAAQPARLALAPATGATHRNPAPAAAMASRNPA